METIYFKPIACFHGQNQTPKINTIPIIKQEEVIGIRALQFNSKRYTRRTFISGDHIEIRGQSVNFNFLLTGRLLSPFQVKVYLNNIRIKNIEESPQYPDHPLYVERLQELYAERNLLKQQSEQ